MKPIRLIALAPLAAALLLAYIPGCSTTRTKGDPGPATATATVPPAPTNTPLNTNTAGPSQTATISRTFSGTFTATNTVTSTATPCGQCTCPPAFSPTAAGTASVVINEVFSDGTATGQWAEIKNVGSNPVSFTNFSLCQFPTYWPFPVGFTLAPGAFVVVHYNQSGTDTGTDLFTGPITANLLPGTGELGLYDCNACSCFGGSACIRDYVEWGNGGHVRESVAVGAGIWFTGSFASAMSGGMSLNLVNGSPGNVGCHYTLAAPSPGS